MRRVARYAWPLLFVWALLGADDCTEDTINQDINATLGIDTDSPGQVASAILLGQTFGDDNQRRAADMGSVLQDFRRADHQEKGDRHLDAGKYDDALREYRQSLQWIGDDPHELNERASIETNMGLAILRRPSGANTKADYREAALRLDNAATIRENAPETAGSPALAGELLVQSAWASYHADDLGTACVVLKGGIRRGAADTGLMQSINRSGGKCSL